MTRLAIFDFDGTLCARNSYHAFIRERMRSSLRERVRLTSAIARRRLGRLSSAELKNVILKGLAGWRRSAVADLGELIYGKELRPFLRRPAIGEVEKRRSAGYECILVSGAFDFLLRPFCNEYGFVTCDCTQIAYTGEVCLGRLEGAEMRGACKCAAVRSRFAEQPVDWQGSCAFADEASDTALMEMVGEQCWVEGDRGEDTMSMTIVRRSGVGS